MNCRSAGLQPASRPALSRVANIASPEAESNSVLQTATSLRIRNALPAHQLGLSLSHFSSARKVTPRLTSWCWGQFPVGEWRLRA